MNKIVEEARGDLSKVVKRHSLNDSGLEEDTLKTVREAYVVHSPDLYDNIKSHGLSVDNVIRLSQYSHRTVYNLVQELSNEQECTFVNLFVISSKGIIEVMFFNRGKDTDMCMTLMKQKSI